MASLTKTEGASLKHKLWKYGGVIVGLFSIYLIMLFILNLLSPPIALASTNGAVIIKPTTIAEYCTFTWGSTSISPGQTTSFQINCIMIDPLGIYDYFIVTYINGQGLLNALILSLRLHIGTCLALAVLPHLVIRIQVLRSTASQYLLIAGTLYLVGSFITYLATL